MVAQIAGPALAADALERVDQVHAGAAVQARIATAVVDVLVAMSARVAGVACALSVAAASASARAWSALAAAAQTVVQQTEHGIVNGWFRAVFTLPVSGTVAVVVGLRVEALREILAGIWCAVIAIDFTLSAGVADRADALVCVDEIAALAAV